jgi:hypothetical protein
VSANIGRRTFLVFALKENRSIADEGWRGACSDFNRYLQSWDASNLFIMGASTFPQQPATKCATLRSLCPGLSRLAQGGPPSVVRWR